MDATEFSADVVPGQRWVSNTEPELGLGIIESSAHRRLVVSFPAAAEKRTYAIDNAPLTRVFYELGETVVTADDVAVRVNERREHEGRIHYVGLDPDGAEVVVDEIELDPFVQFSKPQDRLLAGQIDRLSRFSLRLETLERRARHHASPAFGLLGPRVQLHGHQFYIASRVASRHAPRVLLADEVGLGKTIESGLILHHQLQTGEAARVLIVVPPSLTHQWLVEMLRRFNLSFTILDEDRCEELEGSGEENPFETAQLVLCDLPFLEGSVNRRDQARDAGWDLLVVDEAHHLGWSERESSPSYRCIESLAAGIPGLLLLTATPEQLGVEGHFGRLRLLDPERFSSLSAFRSAEAEWRPLAALVTALEQMKDPGGETGAGSGGRDDEAGAAAAQALGEVRRLLGGEAATDLAGMLEGEPDPGRIDALVERILDCYGTGRVLFRNTRERIGGFPGRLLHAHELPLPEGLEPAPGDGLARVTDPAALFGDGWCSVDPRVDWLIELCRAHPEEKLLLIMAEAGAAEQLEEHLRTRGGVRTAQFHEGMSLLARDRAAAYFAESEDASAQLLVCSEIGSEGRNFQIARHLVLFDLPMVPDLLEQRIGRLDRIGQRGVVNLHVPYFEGTPQAVLLSWYRDGMNAFEQPAPAGNLVHGALGDDLRACLEVPGDRAALGSLVARTRALAEEATAALEAGRDALIELNSHRPREAREVVSSVEAASSELELTDYVERLFDELGVEQERHSARAVILRPSERMTADHFPGLSEDGLTATFHRNEALAREDVAFLTWEHPMVQGAMDLVVEGHFGNTAFCTLKLPAVGAGALIVEAVYVLHCPAPRWLKLARFLPGSVVRVVVDPEGNDLSPIFSAAQFNRLAERVPAARARDFIRHIRNQVVTLVRGAEGIAAGQAAALRASGRAAAAAHHAEEIQRLRDLARVNAMIRPEEVARAEEVARLADTHLESARLRLDSLRVGVTT